MIISFFAPSKEAKSFAVETKTGLARGIRLDTVSAG